MTATLAQAAAAILADLAAYRFTLTRTGASGSAVAKRADALRAAIAANDDASPPSSPAPQACAPAGLACAMSFRGDRETGYVGLYAIVEGESWREVGRADGSAFRFASSSEAEAAAGHAMVAALRKLPNAPQPAPAPVEPPPAPAPVSDASKPATGRGRPRKAARTTFDLASPIKLGAKAGRRVGAFVATFADGHTVRVCGVEWSNIADMWAAAAQAANRLNRSRQGARVANETRAAAYAALRADRYDITSCACRGMMVKGALGIEQRSAAMLAFERVMPLPPLTGLQNEETGETLAIPAELAFGAGDEPEAQRIYATMVGRPVMRTWTEEAREGGRFASYPGVVEGEEARLIRELCDTGDRRWGNDAQQEARAVAIRAKLAALRSGEEQTAPELPLAA